MPTNYVPRHKRPTPNPIISRAVRCQCCGSTIRKNV